MEGEHWEVTEMPLLTCPGLGWQQPAGLAGAGDSLLGLRSLGASSLGQLSEGCSPAWCSEWLLLPPLRGKLLLR